MDAQRQRVRRAMGSQAHHELTGVRRGAAGHQGSPRNFRRLVAKLKLLWRTENHRGRRLAVWSPGEYLVIDWAQAAPGLFLFCAVAFSRWGFVAFAADLKASTTLRRTRYAGGSNDEDVRIGVA